MKLVRRAEGFLLYDGRTEYFQRAPGFRLRVGAKTSLRNAV